MFGCLCVFVGGMLWQIDAALGLAGGAGAERAGWCCRVGPSVDVASFNRLTGSAARQPAFGDGTA